MVKITLQIPQQKKCKQTKQTSGEKRKHKLSSYAKKLVTVLTLQGTRPIQVSKRVWVPYSEFWEIRAMRRSGRHGTLTLCCRLRCLEHQRWRRGWTSSQCDWMSRRETAEKRSASNEIRIQITFDLKIKNHRVMAAISFHYFLASVHRSPQSRENIKDDSLTGWQSTGRSISLRV